MKVVYIDNFDTFAYNLIDEFEKKGCEVTVFRSDVDILLIDNEIKKIKPKLIVIGSGSSIKRAMLSIEIIEKYYKRIPIFAVGLGNECVMKVFDGKVGRSPDAKLGRQIGISHDGKTIFKDLKKEFNVAIYHRLVPYEIPYCLEVTARTGNEVVMAVRHKDFFVEGMQFNPSSILTPEGSRIINNLINEVKKR